MDKLISVIVPVYNVEKYLRRCVDSILCQTYTDLEIILVDDGSKDGCGAICNEYAKMDGRVKAIHKENGGLSSARNCGIEEASGEYICFIDSDDYISPHYVSVLYDACIKFGCDIVQCSFYTFTDEEEFKRDERNESGFTVLNNLEAVRKLTYGDYVSFVVAWNKLYKTCLFKDIRYPEGKIHEDEGTTYKLLLNANKFAFTEEKLYGYYQRQGSITKSKFSLKNFDYITLAKERYKYFENVDYNLYIGFLKSYCFSLVSFYLRACKELNDKQIKKGLLKDYKIAYKPLLHSKNLSFKAKTAILILRFFPKALPLLKKFNSSIPKNDGGDKNNLKTFHG